ncbi:hypothetical protein HK099_007036 [Clydaea vesicula]|uniref:RRM domain-containing protein n=1 Tax=Clydaea vesicula TaxID=447962 RepID=A0AAD5Y0Q4_9FUNG|nr:hypothetical protein HK099_007036 [Clydaea vesicula]KAJ3391411.1 hypothetical protein HDU92_009071 [Lobulomyces angularis]
MIIDRSDKISKENDEHSSPRSKSPNTKTTLDDLKETGEINDEEDKRDYRESSPYDDRRSSRVDYDRRPLPGNERKEPPKTDPSEVIGVFGLSSHITENQLGDMFSEFGRVEKVVLVYDKYTRNSKGYGFVTMDNLDNATRARNALNGQEVSGRAIRVDYSLSKDGRDRVRDSAPPDSFREERGDYRRGSPPPDYYRRDLDRRGGYRRDFEGRGDYGRDPYIDSRDSYARPPYAAPYGRPPYGGHPDDRRPYDDRRAYDDRGYDDRRSRSLYRRR